VNDGKGHLVEDSFQSERGLQLSSVGWLLDHHEAKLAERHQMVDDLCLEPGAVVLDSACGPALWVELFAERVGPTGRVVGLDFSADLIAYAQQHAAAECNVEIIDLILGDFASLPFDADVFDLIFMGNCFCYVSDIVAILEEHKRVTRLGGRVVSKEFDGGSVIFHPVDAALTLKVLAGAAQALEADASEDRFDNFVGRRMHGVFLRAGFKDIVTRSYAIQKVWPLSDATKRYISANADWYSRLAARYLTADERRQWALAFDPNSEGCVLNRDDFYFCMIETVTSGTV
jgi:ubiquinone/menaquinone biosynthesis C-methylase UbiE